MVDTVRSLTELETLLADNISQQVSPQDLRDLMVSLRPSAGRISQQANVAATSITDSVTFFVANLSATVLDANANNFDMPANGRLRYIGTPDRLCTIIFSASINMGGNNVGIHFKLGVNGTVDDATEMESHKGSATAIPIITMTGTFRLSTNDYVEMFMLNHTNTDNITVSYFSMQARGDLI